MTRRSQSEARAAAIAVAGLVALGGFGCGGGGSPPPAATRVGLMLPFTGPSAGFGANAELAVILATEQVNAAGGVMGRPLQLVEGDESGRSDRALEAATDMLEIPDLLGVIGPQSPELIDATADVVQSRGIVAMLPGLSSPPAAQATAGLWFQVSPSPSVLGCALGQRMFDDNAHAIAVIYSDDDYGTPFANAAAARYHKLSGADAMLQPVAGRSTADLLQMVRTLGSQNVVLAVSAAAGAALVDGSPAVGLDNSHFYFGPQLANDSFIGNVLPGLIDGMVGVTETLPPDSDAFAAFFAQRWDAQQPLVNSYFYYDALAILALALESAGASAGPGVTPSTELVKASVRRVANPPGELITWKTIAHGLELVRQGMDINYQGASGSVDFDDTGEIAAGANLIRFWKVADGRIVSELYGSCLQ